MTVLDERDTDDPIYGPCQNEGCDRTGYELHPCGHCHILTCPFCDHWCEED